MNTLNSPVEQGESNRVPVLPRLILRRFGQASLLCAVFYSSAYAIDINVPSVAVTTVDQAKVFSQNNHNAVSLSGSLDLSDSVTMSAASGTLSLSGTSGLSFSSGDGASDATMTFSGTLVDVNTALEGLVYTPSTNAAGSVSLTFSISGTQSASSTLDVAVNATMDAEAARDQILAGVASLADPFQPGRMMVYGDNAYSITNYPDRNIDDPMVAAATWGAGKVLAMPDHQWLNMGSFGGDASTGTFYKNGVAWLAGSTSLGIKVVVYNNQATADWLTAQGFANVVNTTSGNLATDLVGADVFVAGWLGSNVAQSVMDDTRNYVTAGGSLFISEYGKGYSWWWGKSTEDIPGNILLREAGIGFLQDTFHEGRQNINRASGQMSGSDLLTLIQNSMSYTETEKNLAIAIFDDLNVVLQNTDPLRLRLDDVFWAKILTINPTPTTPVSDLLEKAFLDREGQILKVQALVDFTAHRSALPVGVSAPRVNKAVTLAETVTGHDDWMIDTGLYVAPGETVSITVPAALVGIGAKVQVGHLRTDIGDTNYYTMPHQQFFFDIDSTSFDVGSPHGGLLMFVAPSGTEWTGAQSVQANGAVEAPYFVYGTNTNAEWVGGVRDRETPFGVLVSDTAVLVIESEQYLRTLPDPHEVMDIHRNLIWWIDDFYDYHRGRPLRTHHDYQPVGGHASMPLSYEMNSNITDYHSLLIGGEPLTMHEHGHHGDQDNILFYNFGETTPNLGGKYAQQMYLPFSWKQELAVGRINNYQRSLGDDLWGHYNHYAVDVKGTFYDSIGAVFGWDKVRTIVHNISNDGTISTDQDKLDALLVQMSQTVGYDVSPFLEAWQLSFSATAKSTVSSLGQWNMVETVAEDLVVKQDTAVTFTDPTVNDFSYDGTLAFAGMGNPTSGNLVDHGNGTYTYTPNGGFTGDDAIQYTVSNGLGNTFTSTIDITVNAVANFPTLESGDTHAGTSGWATVNLNQSFTSMVVVAQPVVSASTPPVVTRIRNASGSSFEVMLQRVDGQAGAVDNIQTRYLVVEEGVYDVATHGVKMEAVKYTSTVTDATGSFVGEERTMAHNMFDHYFIPTVFGQVMSYNDASWSAFWYKQVSDKVQIGKHIGEDTNTTRANETVGYIIMESGSLQIGDYRFQVGGLGYDGYNNFSRLSGSTASHDFVRFPNITSALVATDISVPWGESNPGDEGSWVVQKLSGIGNSVAAMIVEDQLADSEQDAGRKGGSYILVSYTGDDPVLSDDVAISLGGFSTLVNVLGNDSAGLGGSLSITGFTQPANGSVVDNGDGTLTYTGNASYIGSDFFTYTSSNGNGTDTAVVKIDVQATQASQAGILREKWTGVSGGSISELTNNANYPDTPNSSSILTSFEAPSGDGDSYGQRLTAYLVPPTTGDYTFWIASDDESDLYLSTDYSSLNATRISYVSGWVGEKNWTQNGSQQSVVIALEAGKAYYIEALHKEGSGGDHLAVAWQGPGIAQAVIDGQYLYTVGDNGPSVASPIADVLVNEGAVDTVVDLSAVFEDSDPGDPLTLQVAGNSNPSLVTATLNGTQLTLSYAAGQSGLADISVIAFDRLNTVIVDTFLVDVVSSNMPPVLGDATFGIAEDVTIGTSVGTVSGTDPDVGDLLAYSITAGNTGGALAINASTGEITTAAVLNFETTNSYALTVQVADDGGLTDTATITVNVADVDESALTGIQAWEEAVHQGSAFAHKRTTVLAGNATATVDLSSISGDATYEFVVDAEDFGQTVARLLDGNGWSLRLEQWANSNELGVTRYGVADYQLTAEAGRSVASPYGAVHHIVYVVDSVNAQTRVYVNGVFVGTVSQVPALNTASMTLGGTNLRSDSTTAIHAFAAYNSALDAVEISEHSTAWFGTPSNSAPVAVDDSGVTTEDTAVILTVLTNDSDPEGDSLTVQSVTQGTNGSVTTNGAIVTYTPNADYNGFDSFTYTVSDGNGEIDTATVNVTVNAVNDNPVASADATATDEDTASIVSVLGNDSDIDGDSLTVQSVTQGAGGSVSTDGTTVTYTPIANFNGSDLFTYTVSDGNGGADTATVNVTVNAVNDNPLASTDATATDEDTASVVSVLGNDNDVDGDALTVQSVTQGAGGSVSTDGTTVTYTPIANFNGSDLFTYTVSDGNGGADTATVNVTVNAVNDNPLASTDATATDEDTASVVSVLGNDNDVDGDALTVQSVTQATNGSVTTNGATVTYTPDADYNGSDSFTYTVSDGNGGADTATVNVTVNAVNDNPVANDNSGSVAEDATIGTAVATVSATDADTGDLLSYAITGGNTAGAFAIDSNGNITTAATLDFETLASYSLTVTVTDSMALSDTASVIVTVTDVVEVAAPAISTGSATNITLSQADIAYSVSDDGGEDPTVTLYYGESDGGTTPGAWTSSQALGTQATGNYGTTISGLNAGTTYYFTLHASNSAGEAWGSSGSFTTEADASAKLVRTTVNNVSSTTWTTVNLGKSYNSAVIIATPIYVDSNVAPMVTRIRNVSGSSFDLKIDRVDGQTGEVTADVSVIAVEEGVYTQAVDGVTMEAVKFTSTVTARKSNWNAEARTFQNGYTSPVVVGQVMSYNDSNWSAFWSMGSSRTEPVNASNLNVGKHVAEDSNTTRANETIGYIVIESGSGTLDGVTFTAALGTDIVKGVGNTSTGYNYSLSGLSSASAAAVSISAMDGNDGGWAVLYGANPITSSTLTVVCDEDQIGGSERKHATEQVGYIVFE